MRVLVVEDDTIVAMDMMVILREAGHEPLGPAAASAQAIDIARAEKPDIAFVDIRLQDGATGPAVARTLRSRFKIPCFFVTSFIEDAIANRDAALGVVEKPIEPSALLAAFDVMVGGRRRKRASRLPPGLRLFRR